MRKLVCKHCGGDTEASDKACSHCGIPLPPDHGKNSQRKFILFFIALVIFCAVMVIWLPRDLLQYLGK